MRRFFNGSGMKRFFKQRNNILFLGLLLLALLYFLNRFSIGGEDRKTDVYAVSGWPYSGAGEPDIIENSTVREGALIVSVPEQLEENARLYFYLNEQTAAVNYFGRVIALPRSVDSDMWYSMPLSEDMAGKKLTIYFGSSKAKTPGLLRSVYIGTEEACCKHIRRDILPGLILCFIVFCAGLVSVVLGFYCSEVVETGSAFRHTGILFILLSVWGISNLPQLRMFFESTNALRYIGRIAIMLAPLQFTEVVRLSVRKNRSLAAETEYFRIAFAALFAVCLALDYTGKVSLSITCLWSRVFNIAFMAYILLFGILDSVVMSLDRSYVQNTSRITLWITFFYACFEAWFMAGSYILIKRVVTWSLYAASCILLLTVFIFMLSQARALLRLQEALSESRMRLMMSQIKPHFMYNTLNSIRTMIRKDSDTADTLVLQFARFLRSNIRSIGSENMIPFSQELKMVEAYVAIEEICYPQVHVSYEIEVHNFMIPPLTVQPLVENAIRHGIMPKPDGGIVIVRTREAPDGIFIEVEDNGVGFQATELPNEPDSYGLRNIKSRLEYFCRAKIGITSEPEKGSKVVIFMPHKRNGRTEK